MNSLEVVKSESIFLQRRAVESPVEVKIIPLSCERMQSILQDWRTYIKEKMATKELSPEMKTRLSVCNKVIVNSLLDLKSDKKLYAIEVDSKIEGILIATIQDKKSTFYVDTLASSPRNLSGETQIKGVGSALINRAIQEAKNSGLAFIKLRFFDGAEGFYKKMGMSQTEQGFVRNI